MNLLIYIDNQIEMCVTPYHTDTLENLNKFKYKSSDKSLFYNYFLSPCLDYLVKLLPLRLAANVLTLSSLAFNIASLIVTAVDAGTDFRAKLSKTTCFIQAGFHILYLILDNLDGKQARRTKTASPFGMLLDHGCDVFTNIIVCYNVHHLIRAGSDDIIAVLVYFSLYLGFYCTTYEEYICGEMHLWYINGADEGNLLVAFGSLITGLLKPFWRKRYFLFIHHWVLLGLLLFSINSAIISFFNIYRKKGLRQLLRVFFDWLMFYNVFVIPILYNYFNDYFYEKHLHYIIIVISIIFARNSIELQLNIVLNKKISYSLDMIGCNILLIGTFFIEHELILILIFTAVSIILGTQLAMIIAIRGIEITQFLNIRLLCVPDNKPLISNV